MRRPSRKVAGAASIGILLTILLWVSLKTGGVSPIQKSRDASPIPTIEHRTKEEAHNYDRQGISSSPLIPPAKMPVIINSAAAAGRFPAISERRVRVLVCYEDKNTRQPVREGRVSVKPLRQPAAMDMELSPEGCIEFLAFPGRYVLTSNCPGYHAWSDHVDVLSDLRALSGILLCMPRCTSAGCSNTDARDPPSRALPATRFPSDRTTPARSAQSKLENSRR
jgi:hypothetical protein